MERDYLSSLLNLFRKRINKIFVGLLVIIIAACDFDNPADFVVPTWFIDIKLPLISKRFPMGDLVDTTNFIYPTDDSAGFQLLFTGLIDPPVSTEEMELGVRFPGGYMEQVIPEESIGDGPDGSAIEIEIPGFEFPIEYNFPPFFPFYSETTQVEVIPGSGQWVQDTFHLPIQTPKVMYGYQYNEYFVRPLNLALDAVFSELNGLFPMDLGLSSLTAAITEPQITIDTLLISGTEETSYLRSYFENHGYPTKLRDCSAFFISIDVIQPWLSIRDTIAPHFRSEVGSIFDTVDSIFYMGAFDTTTNLSVEGLTDSVQIFTYFQLDSVHPDSFVTLYPTNDGDMFIGYAFDFSFNGIDSAVVSIDSFNIDLSDQLDAMQSQLNFSSSLPEMEGISFDIKEAEMQSSGFPDDEPIPNQFKIQNLHSSFHWDINFYMKIPNFISPSGENHVLIDEVLRNTDDPFETTIKLYDPLIPAGDLLIPLPPDTTIGSVDLDLQVWIPGQQVTIPLDGSSLGGFGVTVQFGSLFFEELKAYVNMDLTADTMDISGFPPELTGVGFPELEFEFELFNEIDFPLSIDINMLGTKPSGVPVVSRLNAKLGVPSYIESNYGIDVDTVLTKILWSDAGTEISFYAPPSSPQPTEVTLIPPAPGEFSIIDFFGSMPLVAIADIKTRINGTAGITGKESQIWGSFTIKMPFSVTMNAPPFIPPSGISKLDEFSHDNRNKIRHSLIESEFSTNIENSLPLGGEFAILLSDQPFFPKDITTEALSTFRDTMITQYGWDSTDVLYIVDKCDSLSPAKGNIYVFNVMSDSSQCVDGMKYLVKRSLDSEVDTVISYVDTLFRILLPSPLEYYSDTSTVGHPGQVAVPGVTGYCSVLDTSRIFLLTDYGDHYVVPRFSFNQTGDQAVFFSRYDAIDIRSFITFRVASTGVFGATENDIVILYPNGGENLVAGFQDTIRWKTYGPISNVDVHYAIGANPSDDDWEEIVLNIVNDDSYAWTPTEIADSVRIKITDSNSELNDVSGWYFNVSSTLLGRTSTGRAVINRGKLKRSGETR